MTVIVYRDGVPASDTGVFSGNQIIGEQMKIRTDAGLGLTWACAGCSDEISVFEDWLRSGAYPAHRPPKVESFGALICHRDGRVWQAHGENIIYELSDVKPRHYTQGSHADFLQGVLVAGCSAVQAVEYAIKWCAYAGGECVAFDVARQREFYRSRGGQSWKRSVA